MIKAVHLLKATLDDIRESLAGFWGEALNVSDEIPGTAADPDIIAAIAVQQNWTSVILHPETRLTEIASTLTHRKDRGCLAMQICLPDEWTLHLFDCGNPTGRYSWLLPEQFHDEQLFENLSRLERLKLQDLGMEISVHENSLLKSGESRINSQDPHLEMSYRARISEDDLIPPVPQLDDELPERIVRVCGRGRKAKIRKILGRPHLSIAHMISAFAGHMNIETAFLSYEEALDCGGGVYTIHYLSCAG